jgi:tRNA uridine 5-carbamoylmethylation protein Kti12
MTKWIVFNGPPQSGKTTAAAIMRSRIWEAARRTNSAASVHVDSFAAPTKHFVAMSSTMT